MVRDGLIPEGSFWGTINCDGIGPNGDICGVTTTSGLAWKIPGPHRRLADPRRRPLRRQRGRRRRLHRPRRGESLQPVVVPDRRADAARACRRRTPAWRRCKRIKANTIEKRLLNAKGKPNFNIRFFVLNKRGEYAGVAMYRAGETKYAVCTENGAQALELEPLLPGAPED